MITFPDEIAPNNAMITLVDLGFTQEGAAGLGDRIDRPGNHFSCDMDFPAMRPALARIFVARITRAMRQGLKVEIPLQGVNQGIPGAPVVDGDEPTGTTLPLRGLTPGYAVKEGYWLTVVEALTGQGYAHLVQAAGIADGDGKLEVDVDPPIRAPFADGDAVLLAKPTIEGVLRSPPSWALELGEIVRNGARLTIEEQA